MNAIQFINEMDTYAQMYYGEFGYDTCDNNQKKEIIKALFEENK
jgi:hypothetical protein